MTYPECWPGTKVPRSLNNAFACGSGEPIDWKPLAESSRLSTVNSKRVAKAVAAGKNPSTINGLNRSVPERSLVHPGSMS